MTATPVYSFSELLADGVLAVDDTGHIVYANASLLELLDYSSDALIGQPLSILIPTGQRDKHAGLVEKFRDGDVSHMPMASRSILYALDRRRRELPVSISIAKIPDGDEVRMIAIMRRLPTELSELRIQAETDSLTGAANRVYLSKRIKELVDQGDGFGLLYVDLDGFKSINDVHGHAAGDRILKIVVRRIQRVIRAKDLVARVGGDEFVVLLAGIESADELGSIAKKMSSQVAEKIRLQDFDLSVSVSIGCVNSPRDGTAEEMLLERADAAMYKAKKSRERYHFYSASS